MGSMLTNGESVNTVVVGGGRQAGQPNPAPDWIQVIRDYAHDLNSQLQPIVSLTAMALEDLPRDSDTWGDLEMVQAAAGQAATLVSEMSDFASSSMPETAQTAVFAALAQTRSITCSQIRIDMPCGLAIDGGKLKETLAALFSDLATIIEPADKLAITADDQGISMDLALSSGHTHGDANFDRSLAAASRRKMSIVVSERSPGTIGIRVAFASNQRSGT